MKAIQPIGFDISLKKLKDGNWKMKYTEEFDKSMPGYEKIVDNTIKMIGEKFREKLIGGSVKIEKDKNKVSLEIEDIQDNIFPGLCAEFLFMSNFGKVTITDLFSLLYQ